MNVRRPPLATIGPRFATIDTRAAVPPPKQADPIYHTPEYQVWRETVIARAGRRCEAVDHGLRCRKAEPHHRMFADHVIEIKDLGARFDPANGKCLCGSHHTTKTVQARARRLGG